VTVRRRGGQVLWLAVGTVLAAAVVVACSVDVELRPRPIPDASPVGFDADLYVPDGALAADAHLTDAGP
jgi:hypothetical protein